MNFLEYIDIDDAKLIEEYLHQYINKNINNIDNIKNINKLKIKEFLNGVSGTNILKKKTLNIKKYKNKLKNFNNKCFYCNDSLDLKDVSLDHIIPESLG